MRQLLSERYASDMGGNYSTRKMKQDFIDSYAKARSDAALKLAATDSKFAMRPPAEQAEIMRNAIATEMITGDYDTKSMRPTVDSIENTYLNTLDEPGRNAAYRNWVGEVDKARTGADGVTWDTNINPEKQRMADTIFGADDEEFSGLDRAKQRKIFDTTMQKPNAAADFLSARLANSGYLFDSYKNMGNAVKFINKSGLGTRKFLGKSKPWMRHGGIGLAALGGLLGGARMTA